MVEFCITFVREKVDDMDIGKMIRQDIEGIEEAPERAVEDGVVAGKKVLSGLDEIKERIFRSRGRREGGAAGDGGESGCGRGVKKEDCGEGRRLLDAAGRYGYGMFEGREEYGYHEGMMYPSSSGQDRLKYSDGTSESSGCVGPLHGHREGCVGECGFQTRRRSRES